MNPYRIFYTFLTRLDLACIIKLMKGHTWHRSLIFNNNLSLITTISFVVIQMVNQKQEYPHLNTISSTKTKIRVLLKNISRSKSNIHQKLQQIYSQKKSVEIRKNPESKRDGESLLKIKNAKLQHSEKRARATIRKEKTFKTC
ncbi:hypothetical protein ACKWTF_011540 [Chironomus riparius]